jgi:hypothetical protein
MSLIDEDVLRTRPWIERIRLRHAIKVKGVNGDPLDAWEAVTLPIFLPDSTNKRMAKITREFHIVQDLDCGIIFGNDVIGPEKISIDVSARSAVVKSCKNMPCQIRVTPRRKVSNHTVRCAKTTLVPARSTITLPIRHAGLNKKQHYLLMPMANNAYLPGGAYVVRSVIDGDQEFVLVTNVTDDTLNVPKGARIGTIESFDNAQETRFWPQATREMESYFCGRVAEGRRNEKISVPDVPDVIPESRFTKMAQVVKHALSKPKGSRAVHINETDDITPQQMKALREVLAKHEPLFSD